MRMLHMTELDTELGKRAAHLAVEAVALMNRAFDRSGLQQRDLASRLGVSESRVSHILNGDGNVRTATLARVFAALGYKVGLDVHPLSSDVPSLKRVSPRRPRGASAARSEPIISIVSEIVPDTVPSAWVSEHAIPPTWSKAEVRMVVTNA